MRRSLITTAAILVVLGTPLLCLVGVLEDCPDDPCHESLASIRTVDTISTLTLTKTPDAEACGQAVTRPGVCRAEVSQARNVPIPDSDRPLLI